MLKKRKKRSHLKKESLGCYVFVGIIALLCVLPFWIIFVGSISDESEIIQHGFSMIPRNPGLATYSFILSQKGAMLLRAFGVTFAAMVLGTLYTMVITTTFAYVVSLPKDKFRFSTGLSFFAWFTTVFSGGVLPWYILMSQYYHLKNNIFALFIPYGMNVFFMFVLKNNFKAIPEELVEAAEIDGASDATIFFKIALPMAKVGLVTVGLFTVLQYWNDFYLSLYLVSSTELYTVQKLLYNMMSNISALLSGAAGSSAAMHMVIPSNGARMAMTMFTVVPIMVFYPFVQKYFVKGMTVGAVKG